MNPLDSKPLGYWLKLLDHLIEEHLNRVLAAEDVHRRHWQTMNLLRSRPGRAAVTEELRPFWTGSTVTVDEVLEELVRRGWITGREPYGLTPAGEAAHAALARTVERAGRQIREGVTPRQYADTVGVLRRLVENAESLRRSASHSAAMRCRTAETNSPGSHA